MKTQVTGCTVPPMEGRRLFLGTEGGGRLATPDTRLCPQVERAPLAQAGNCPSPGRLRATERGSLSSEAHRPERPVCCSPGRLGGRGRGGESLEREGPGGSASGP